MIGDALAGRCALDDIRALYPALVVSGRFHWAALPELPFHMPKAAAVTELDAAHGEKMIEVKLRFWTNDIASDDGKILPKHAWASGVVRMEKNRAHGVVPGKPIPFHSLLDITSAIEKALIEHGITLHIPRRMTKYVDRKG